MAIRILALGEHAAAGPRPVKAFMGQTSHRIAPDIHTNAHALQRRNPRVEVRVEMAARHTTAGRDTQFVSTKRLLPSCVPAQALINRYRMAATHMGHMPYTATASN